MEPRSAIAYGKQYPEFWMGRPFDRQPATVGNGTYAGFIAPSQTSVHAFYATALTAGATDDGAPDDHKAYGEPYYGCFVRDLDGHKIDAADWDG